MAGDTIYEVRQKGYPLTPKECLKIGGHCYKVSPIVMTSNPPTYERICKHCGNKQWGNQQPDVNWHDVN